MFIHRPAHTLHWLPVGGASAIFTRSSSMRCRRIMTLTFFASMTQCCDSYVGSVSVSQRSQTRQRRSRCRQREMASGVFSSATALPLYGSQGLVGGQSAVYSRVEGRGSLPPTPVDLWSYLGYFWSIFVV